MVSWLRRNYLQISYLLCMAAIMLGYVRYDPYHPNGDSISYMDLAASVEHGRWHEVVNGVWNPGYPFVLAIGQRLLKTDRMHELYAFYWVNYAIFILAIICATYFARSLIDFRKIVIPDENRGEIWTVPDTLLYLLIYAVVFTSWQQEYSPGHILVDALYSSLLILAYALLIRAHHTLLYRYYAALGFVLGLLYLVKSPGAIAGIILIFALFAVDAYKDVRISRAAMSTGIALATFLIVAGPYVTALSIQKGRFTWGETARLNYAWRVAGTQMGHLLPYQVKRFGDSTVRLKHPEHQILADPVVVTFADFPHATYGAWFDPSYYNEGIVPHISLIGGSLAALHGGTRVFRFAIARAKVLCLVLLLLLQASCISSQPEVRRLFRATCLVVCLLVAMFLPFGVFPRYIAGAFWILLAVTFSFMTLGVVQQSRRQAFAEGAVRMFVLIVLAVGIQQLSVLRRTDIRWLQNRPGWQPATQVDVVEKLRKYGIEPGQQVACFLCFNGDAWPSMAGVRITSEIWDQRYILKSRTAYENWLALPNKESIDDALRKADAQAIIAFFKERPYRNQGWRHLAGDYYLFPLRPTDAGK